MLPYFVKLASKLGQQKRWTRLSNVLCRSYTILLVFARKIVRTMNCNELLRSIRASWYDHLHASKFLGSRSIASLMCKMVRLFFRLFIMKSIIIGGFGNLEKLLWYVIIACNFDKFWEYNFPISSFLISYVERDESRWFSWLASAAARDSWKDAKVLSWDSLRFPGTLLASVSSCGVYFFTLFSLTSLSLS